MSRRSHLIPLLLALGLAGCSKAPSPEQQQADVALAKARTYMSRGEGREARTFLMSALALDEGLGRGSKVAEEERLIGDLYLDAASFDSALIYYSLSSDQYRNLADRAHVQEVTLDIAAMDGLMGEHRKALALYTEALRLAKVFGDQEGVRDIEWAMLPTCRALDDHEQEFQLIDDLQKTYGSGSDLGPVARVFFASGIALFEQSRLDSSARTFERAYTVAMQAGDSVLACTSLLRIAMAMDAAGKTREGLQSYADALRLVDKLRGAQQLRMELLCRVGNIYLRSRQYTEAARFYRAAMSSALAARNRIAEGYLDILLGHCDLDASRESAGKNYRAAFDLFSSLSYPPGLSYALLSLAAAAQTGGEHMEALQDLTSAVEQSELFIAPRARDDVYAECEHAFLGQSPTPAYDECIGLLFQLGKTDEAYWYLERKNNRCLHDALASLDPRTTDEETNAAIEQFSHDRAARIGAERQLERTLETASHQKELTGEVREALNRDAQQLAASGDKLAKLSPALDPFVRTRTFSIADVQKKLPEGTALVDYALTRRSLYAIVLTGSKVAVQVSAVERPDALSLGGEFINLLRTRAASPDSPQTFLRPVDQRLQELSTLLYEAFIRPVERDLAGSTSLYIVLPSELPSLPLHALRTGSSRISPFVAEQYAVSYLPDAVSLFLHGAGSGAVHDVVGIGCPGESTWDVEYELRDIRAFFKEARLYFGQQATPATLQKEHGDVLHLAVEYRYHTTASANSFLYLSDNQSGSGLKAVLLGDLFSVPPYSAVVVSNLTNGLLYPAEPYPFLAGGSNVVIMNSYVPSRKTKKYFGEVFYTALLGGATCQQAFRKVQQEMMKNPEFSATYIWAPFFLWGK